MRRVPFWVVLSICTLISLVLLVYPLTVIQPFKHQNQGDLLRALLVFRLSPAGTAATATIALLTVVFSWRGLRVLSRIGSVVAILFLCLLALASRVNVFEQMFHPAGAPRFLAAKEAKLDGDDMLIAVAVHGTSHAYPIREMGYHHVVNDWVGGTPIVATY